jgi:hypothetical protein
MGIPVDLGIGYAAAWQSQHFELVLMPGAGDMVGIVGKRWNNPEYLSKLTQTEGSPRLIKFWRSPVFREKFRNVPAVLLPRLSEMASEVPVTDLGRRMYYERVHALLAVEAVATRADVATLQLADSPSDAERRLGRVIGQAFHQGCTLADVAMAARLPADQVVAIGKRTIRGTGWLQRI